MASRSRVRMIHTLIHDPKARPQTSILLGFVADHREQSREAIQESIPGEQSRRANQESNPGVHSPKAFQESDAGERTRRAFQERFPGERSRRTNPGEKSRKAILGEHSRRAYQKSDPGERSQKRSQESNPRRAILREQTKESFPGQHSYRAISGRAIKRGELPQETNRGTGIQKLVMARNW